MKDTYILDKDHLKGFLRKIAKERRIVAPVRNEFGDVLLEELIEERFSRLDLTEQAQESAKQYLFPQQDTLFSYRTDPEGGYGFTPAYVERPTVYFGLRSCDIEAILYMDRVFLKAPRDAYYLRRRRDAILIGIGCNVPGENCFCNATRTGPFLQYGYDLQLTDLGDRYFVEAGRAKGEDLVGRWLQFFQPTTEEDVRRQYQIVLESRAGFQRQVHVHTAFQRLARGEVDEAVWQDLAARCQGCGGCAYVCPTCTCFTIEDRAVSSSWGERLRCWDACTHAGFTRMAGGHNPVDMETETLKRRFMHKLYYDYAKHGRPSCVGCGRCVGMCFGGVDIVRFVDQVCESGRERRESPQVLLGKLLLEASLISSDELNQALVTQEKTRRPLGIVLIEMGCVSREALEGALALQKEWRKGAERGRK